MFVFNRDFRYVYIYIYTMWPYVKLYAHGQYFITRKQKVARAQWYVMWEELSVNHFLLKHNNHLKRTLKYFLNGTVRFGYCLTFNLLTTVLLPW